MPFASEIALVAGREVRRNLQSRKGLATFCLFFLGGSIPVLLQMYVARIELNFGGQTAGSAGSNPELRRAMLEKLYDAEAADHLLSCPNTLLFLFRGTLVFLPLLILLVGYDQLVGEIQRGSIRYFLPRAHRPSLVIGKALGAWLVIAAMTLVLHGAVWLALLWQGEFGAASILSWGGRIWFFCIMQGVAYAGLTALLSACARTPAVALVGGTAILFAMGLANTLLGLSTSTRPLTWLFAGTYDLLFVSPHLSHIMGGVALLVGWGLLWVMVSSVVITRRDL